MRVRRRSEDGKCDGEGFEENELGGALRERVRGKVVWSMLIIERRRAVWTGD